MEKTFLHIRIDSKVKEDFKDIVGEKGMSYFVVKAIKKHIKEVNGKKVEREDS